MSDPTLRLMSCGAGVQSSALVLAVADGLITGLDAAIFADTGWEPPQVYTQVERIETTLAEKGIPLHRVSRGNLRDDVLNRHVYATIPAAVLKSKSVRRRPRPWGRKFGNYSALPSAKYRAATVTPPAFG